MSWNSLGDYTPVARKTHRCIWCGEDIVKGEKYRLVTGKMDGDFQSNHFHPECDKACRTIAGEHEDGFTAYEFKRGTTEEK